MHRPVLLQEAKNKYLVISNNKALFRFARNGAYYLYYDI